MSMGTPRAGPACVPLRLCRATHAKTTGSIHATLFVSVVVIVVVVVVATLYVAIAFAIVIAIAMVDREDGKDGKDR